MKKLTTKSLTLTATIAAFLFAISAFAEPSKMDSKPQKASVKNTEATNDDPDLKISIEELRKKYPISWMAKKYGNYLEGGCEGPSGDIEVSAICGFFLNESDLNNFISTQPSFQYLKSVNTTNKLKILDSIFLDPFTLRESEIKSILLNDNIYTEPRSQSILKIILYQLSNANFSHPLKNKIRNFINHDKVKNYMTMDCVSVHNFSDKNEFYEIVALNFLEKSKINSLINLAKKAESCLSSNNLPAIKEKFLKQNPQIK